MNPEGMQKLLDDLRQTHAELLRVHGGEPAEGFTRQLQQVAEQVKAAFVQAVREKGDSPPALVLPSLAAPTAPASKSAAPPPASPAPPASTPPAAPPSTQKEDAVPALDGKDLWTKIVAELDLAAKPARPQRAEADVDRNIWEDWKSGDREGDKGAKEAAPAPSSAPADESSKKSLSARPEVAEKKVERDSVESRDKDRRRHTKKTIRRSSDVKKSTGDADADIWEDL